MSKELSKKYPTSYCPLAWTHSFINQDGSYQVCCSSEEFDNHIRDDHGNKIFISDQRSSEDVLNSNFMNDLRAKMLKGEWPELCKRCKITEDHGGSSRRNIEILNYEKENDEFIKKTSLDGKAFIKITSADFRLGNLCNLQCRMCNPRSTQLWIKEWNEIKPEREKFSKEVMDSYSEYHWIDSESLVKDVENKAKYLTHIHFAGGEPLIVPQMSKILQKCIDAGAAKNITLTYNTNLVTMPQKVLDLWRSFKAVKILASIDAYGDLNHYIRYPANWDKIDKNLGLIEKMHAEYNIIECIVSTTVQVLNILRIEDLYEYLAQFKFIVPVPNLINVYMPTYFKTTVLPPDLKEIASEKFLRLKEKYEKNIPDHYKYLSDNIDQIVKFMNSEDEYTTTDGFKEFIDFQMKFDQSRNIDLYHFYPEFKKYS